MHCFWNLVFSQTTIHVLHTWTFNWRWRFLWPLQNEGEKNQSQGKQANRYSLYPRQPHLCFVLHTVTWSLFTSWFHKEAINSDRKHKDLEQFFWYLPDNQLQKFRTKIQVCSNEISASAMCINRGKKTLKSNNFIFFSLKNCSDHTQFQYVNLNLSTCQFKMTV